MSVKPNTTQSRIPNNTFVLSCHTFISLPYTHEKAVVILLSQSLRFTSSLSLSVIHGGCGPIAYCSNMHVITPNNGPLQTDFKRQTREN